jgi:hypothetical protein
MKLTITIFFLSLTVVLFSQEKSTCYKLRIKSEEYPLFSQSVFTGIYENGGSLDYSIEVQKERTGLYVHVSICDRSIAESIKYRLSQEVVNVLSSIPSLDNISEQDQWKLNALKSINKKIDYALKNPSRPEVTLRGLLSTSGDVIFLSTLNDGNLLLTSRTRGTLNGYIGQQVIANGFQNEDGSVEVTSLLPVRENTLELFIMSQCPFGLQAAERLIAFKSRQRDVAPEIEIRYIFYETPEGFTAMHGEAELQENVVQILIRDNNREHFFDYLSLRIQDEAAAWQTLAKEAGIKPLDIQTIEAKLSSDKEDIIKHEYDYVAKKHKIADGSPTYVWEGQQVGNISLLKAFKNLNLELSGNCAN